MSKIIEMPDEAYEEFDWLHTLPGYKNEVKLSEVLSQKGGAGSGNFGHSGRAGLQGGSARGVGLDKGVYRHKVFGTFDEAQRDFMANEFKNLSGDDVGWAERGGAFYVLPDQSGIVYDATHPRLSQDKEAIEKFGGDWGWVRKGSIKGHTSGISIYLTVGKMDTDTLRKIQGALDKKMIPYEPYGKYLIAADDQAGGWVHTDLATIMDANHMNPYRIKGGPGSGNFGHAGRIGKWGGSAPAGLSRDLSHHGTGMDINIPVGYTDDDQHARELGWSLEDRRLQEMIDNGSSFDARKQAADWVNQLKNQGRKAPDYNYPHVFQTKEDHESTIKEAAAGIAGETGLPESAAEKVIASWGYSSNGTWTSAQLNKILEDEFDSPRADFQKKRYEEQNSLNEKISFGEELYQKQQRGEITQEEGQKLLAQKFPYTSNWDTPAQMHAANELNQPAEFATDLTEGEISRVAHAMYNNTQKRLRDAGIGPDDQVPLFRGVQIRNRAAHAGTKIKYTGNSLESWSADANTGHLYSGNGLALAMMVPARMIFSFAKTGCGTIGEAEFTVLAGGENEATVYSNYFDDPHR